jgi:hypothetical protein
MDFSELRHLPEKTVTAKIDQFLKAYVEKLLNDKLPKLLTGHPDQPVLPQVRVRVEYFDEKHQVFRFSVSVFSVSESFRFSLSAIVR